MGLCVMRANSPIAFEQSSLWVLPWHSGSSSDGSIPPFPPCPPRLLCSKVEPAPQTRPTTSVLGNPVWKCGGSRTRKVQEDLLGIVGQAFDIRCQPHRGPGSQGAKEQREDQLRRFGGAGVHVARRGKERSEAGRQRDELGERPSEISDG